MDIVTFLKKEGFNLAGSILFAYTLSVLINQTVSLVFLNNSALGRIPAINGKTEKAVQKHISIDSMLQKTFFEKGDTPVEEGEIAEPENAAAGDLELLGTITGNSSFARALIRKKSENLTDVFKRGDDVFGYRLKSIRDTTVLLISGKTELLLDMYPVNKEPSSTSTTSQSSSSAGGTISKSLSRAELTQDTQNNLDNMLRGIRAGPYRENNQVVGYQLKAVSSTNLLYKYGMRSGDVIRRINGHPIDSTAKLVELWQQFPKESRVLIDIQRNGSITTFDYTISD